MARGRGADRGTRPAPHPRGGGRRAGPGRLPDRAEGRRPRRGQGRDPLRRRGRGARRARRLLHRAPLRRDRGGAGGVPRGRRALAAGALRRRERGAALPRPGLQADLRRRRGAEHRRHGQLLAGAGASARRRSRRSSSEVHRPIVAAMADARHPLPRRPLRRADDQRRRPQGDRVQRPLRRPRDAGGAAAAALRPRRPLPRRARAGRPRRDERRLRRRLGGDRGARLGRVPGELLEGRRDPRARPRRPRSPR